MLKCKNCGTEFDAKVGPMEVLNGPKTCVILHRVVLVSCPNPECRMVFASQVGAVQARLIWVQAQALPQESLIVPGTSLDLPGKHIG